MTTFEEVQSKPLQTHVQKSQKIFGLLHADYDYNYNDTMPLAISSLVFLEATRLLQTDAYVHLIIKKKNLKNFHQGGQRHKTYSNGGTDYYLHVPS